MKTNILFLLTILFFSSFSAMGQNPITRNKTQTEQTKPKPKPKPQPNSQSQPEELGYDVSFSCNVSSATLYIDGNDYGNASGSKFLKTGNHSIKITASGYEEYTSQITVNRQNSSFDVVLVKLNIPEEVVYDVRFSCNVPTGILYIDNTIVGNAEGSYSLKEGSYTIKVIAKGYEDYEENIIVNQKIQTCRIHLVRETIDNAGYDVLFSCNVPSAILYIDGNINGKATGPRFLKTGTHLLSIKAHGYEDYNQQIMVNQPNQSYTVELVKLKGVNDTIKVKNVEFVMVYVEGGKFTMGATHKQDKEAKKDEQPTHEVTLDDYYIGQTEVTQALWSVVMGNNSPGIYRGDYYPVTFISWDDCQLFISKLNQLTGVNFRLPTEAEWEYAARGGQKSRGYIYAGSNLAEEVAWYNGKKTYANDNHLVATKVPNELDLYDMSGNVCEWCQDWYGDYPATSQTNPQGPETGSRRVLRGGSSDFSEKQCRVSSRSLGYPTWGYGYIGFRLMLPINQ